MKLDRLPLIWRYLLIIWLIATLLNINKAYHIDDTFHFEAAENIKANPTHQSFIDFRQLRISYAFIAIHLYISIFILLSKTTRAI